MLEESLRNIVIGEDRYSFNVRKGEVISVKTWSETRISSTTARGMHGAWLASIDSDVIEITDVYVKEEGGVEFSQRLYNTNVSVREGNQVALIYANDFAVGFVNYDQKQYWWFASRVVVKELFSIVATVLTLGMGSGIGLMFGLLGTIILGAIILRTIIGHDIAAQQLGSIISIVAYFITLKWGVNSTKAKQENNYAIFESHVKKIAEYLF